MSFLQRTLRLTQINSRALALRHASNLSTDGSASPSASTDPAPQASEDPSSPSKSVILLSDIGKSLHPFPVGTFQHPYSPPVFPPYVLKHRNSRPFTRWRTIQAGPNAGKSLKIPTVPIEYDNADASPAAKWMVDHFQTAFKAQLAPDVLVDGQVPTWLLQIYRNNMVYELRAQAKRRKESARHEATEATL